MLPIKKPDVRASSYEPRREDWLGYKDEFCGLFSPVDRDETKMENIHTPSMEGFLKKLNPPPLRKFHFSVILSFKILGF